MRGRFNRSMLWKGLEARLPCFMPNECLYAEIWNKVVQPNGVLGYHGFARIGPDAGICGPFVQVVHRPLTGVCFAKPTPIPPCPPFRQLASFHQRLQCCLLNMMFVLDMRLKRIPLGENFRSFVSILTEPTFSLSVLFVLMLAPVWHDNLLQRQFSSNTCAFHSTRL